MSHRNREEFTVLSCVCIIALFCGIEFFTAVTSRAQEAAVRPAAKGKLSTLPARPLDGPLPPNIDKS